MALSQELLVSRNGARFTASRILVVDAAANTSGVWWDTLQMHPFSVVISGTFAATVTVLVSNGIFGIDTQGRPYIAKPSDSDNGFPALGPDAITAPYSVLSDGPYKYVKVRITNYVSGTVSAAWGAALNVNEKG